MPQPSLEWDGLALNVIKDGWTSFQTCSSSSQGSYGLAQNKFQDYSRTPKVFSRTLS